MIIYMVGHDEILLGPLLYCKANTRASLTPAFPVYIAEPRGNPPCLGCGVNSTVLPYALSPIFVTAEVGDSTILSASSNETAFSLAKDDPDGLSGDLWTAISISSGTGSVMDNRLVNPE